ncbi:MAG TPA: DUF2156 domain-containing protein [Catenuloplanes sp.]|jgi:lysylphosphatidylglycerol synthetase-like protein (DUF2156 family)
MTATQLYTAPVLPAGRPVPPGSAPHRAGRRSRLVRMVLRRCRLTLALLLTLWVVGAASDSLLDGPSDWLLGRIGTGVPALTAGHWWAPVTAGLWCSDLLGYLVTTGLLVVVCAPAERRLGSARTALLLVGTQVVGATAGVALLWVAQLSDDDWSRRLAGELTVGPSGAVIGLALAASNLLGPLWRRRIRLVLLVTLVTFVAYSGQLADVLRLLTGLTGLLAGAVLLRRDRVRRPFAVTRALAATRSETRVLVALLVAATALGPLVAAFSTIPIGPLSVLRFLLVTPTPDPEQVVRLCVGRVLVDDCHALQTRLRFSGLGAGIMSILPVLLMLTVAEGLRRGRRFAWVVALVLNLLLAGFGVLLAITVANTPAAHRAVYIGAIHSRYALTLLLPVLVPLLSAGLLLLTRAHFDVRAPLGTYRRLGVLTGGTLALLSAGYVAGGVLLRDGFNRTPTVGVLLTDLPGRFVPPGYLGEANPAIFPVSPPATLLYDWIGVVFWAVLIGAAVATFWRFRTTAVPADAVRARELLNTHGGSSLSYLTLWRGNDYWFSPDGQAAVAYRVVANVAITTGDPIGVAAARTAAVAQFAAFCTDNGWIPCFYSISETMRAATAALGWRAVQVAEETVVPLRDLAFTGRKWQDVRTALNKAGKQGIAAQWCGYRQAPLALTTQIREISEEWVADKGLPEMGFTLGGLEELADDNVRCLVAVDGCGLVHGVTSWLPVYHAGETIGWTLDFMRRRREGFPGVMEFLIASAALQFRTEGALFISLSGAPLARMDRGERIGVLQRVLDFAGQTLEPVYGFRSLLAFKAKFQPSYHPLYLAYPDPAALPSIATTIARAYLPRVTPRQTAKLLRQLANP